MTHTKNKSDNGKIMDRQWEDYGESSLTLLAVLVGINKKEPAIPYDPQDFKRCIHLFECLNLEQNEIFDLLNETANKYPQWRMFTDNWDTLTDLYEEEKEQNFAPKLYELMKCIRLKTKYDKRRGNEVS